MVSVHVDRTLSHANVPHEKVEDKAPIRHSGGSHKGDHCSTSHTRRQSSTISGAISSRHWIVRRPKQKNDPNMNDLKQLGEITQRLADRNKSGAASPVLVPRVPEANSTPVPRVPEENSTRLPTTTQTRLMRVKRQLDEQIERSKR